MTFSPIKLSKIQALESIALCLVNANSFLNDLNMSIKNDKIDHLPIFVQFSAEEVAKAIIILNKLKSGSDHITITKNDGIYDHKKKLEILLENIDLPESKKQTIAEPFVRRIHGRRRTRERTSAEIIMRNCIANLLQDKKDNLVQKTRIGHKARLDSTFVDFDPSGGNPRLGHGMKLGDIQLVADSISQLIAKIESDSANL